MTNSTFRPTGCAAKNILPEQAGLKRKFDKEI
jgi:hypothetical protein